jgi:hypothetical protein
MTKKQRNIIHCAYLDLVGSMEAALETTIDAHDWRAHALTIEEIAEAFPFVKEGDK